MGEIAANYGLPGLLKPRNGPRIRRGSGCLEYSLKLEVMGVRGYKSVYFNAFLQS
jgi:hypothetical protein